MTPCMQGFCATPVSALVSLSRHLIVTLLLGCWVENCCTVRCLNTHCVGGFPLWVYFQYTRGHVEVCGGAPVAPCSS